MKTLPRQQWERLLVPALVILILGPFVLYARLAVRAAREIARDDALERNLATAVLGARLIDEQCETALSVLSTIARHRSLVAMLRQAGPTGGEAVEQHLHEALDVLPELAFVATYTPKGRLLAHAPSSAEPIRNAAEEDWFRGVTQERVQYVSEVYRLGGEPLDQVVGLAVPVGPSARPVGYLMAAYRLRGVHEWLRPLRIGSGGVLFVLDTDGQMVASSGTLRYGSGHLKDYPPVHRALAEEQGALVAAAPDAQGQALVAFAPARVPGWAVVAIQPLRAALASSDQLIRHLALLAAPYLALMVAGGWAIQWLYHRQSRLARQNAALSRDLAVQNERLRVADRAKSEFLANVSHDLRTPLASIKASVSGLLEPDIRWDQEALHGFLTLVNEETDRLTGRVRNLLDMARLEAGALPTQKEVCDLTDIVASALERLEPLTRGRALDADFPPDPLLVEVDYAQMETVLLNLLENAVKYSPPGTPLHLSGSVTEGAGVLFTLRDHGPGVPPADEQRVFEKFYRSTARTSAGGTGLGLAICKAIVSAHVGAIGVRPAPEGGAEFWVSLPLYRGADARLEEPSPPWPPSPNSGRGGKGARSPESPPRPELLTVHQREARGRLPLSGAKAPGYAYEAPPGLPQPASSGFHRARV